MSSYQDDPERYLQSYLIIVIDPATGNETTIEFFPQRPFIVSLTEAIGWSVSDAMRLLKMRSESKTGRSM